MNVRGCCFACSAELWVEPIVCHVCDEGFCLECITDGIGICTRCCKRAREEEERPPAQCYTARAHDSPCMVWSDTRMCMCGDGEITKCVEHVDRCKECGEEICWVCRGLCNGCGFTCPNCSQRYHTSRGNPCVGACARLYCVVCTSRTRTGAFVCRDDSVICKIPGCPGFCVFAKRCAYPTCGELACTSRDAIVCHTHHRRCSLCSKGYYETSRRRLLGGSPCNCCWDRLKHGAALLQYLGVPKDIIRLIIIKAAAARLPL
jgi:hypothetical protein